MTDLLAELQATLGDAYLVEREMGGGGMSRLFLATERSLGRSVVVKVLPPEFGSDVSAARFTREIMVAARLQHTNILPVLTAGARGDLLYYVMPFASGESLRHRLTRESKFPLAEALRLLSEVADALAYAHAEGIVHRDVKPENILMLSGHAVLTDFGIARALAETVGHERLTGTGLAIGTPAYMAPEQAAGSRDVDARADIYALGVVAYEILTGQPPFSGPTPHAVIAAHLTEPAPRVTVLRPDTPPGVAEAIARALTKEPAERLSSAAELRNACTDSMTAPRGATRRRPALVTGIASVVLLVILGVVLLTRAGSPPFDANLVAVAPVDILARGHELWHEGLVDVLSRNLDGAGVLRSVSPTVVVRRWKGRADRASAAALATATGAGLVVYGSLDPGATDSVRLSVGVFDARAQRSLGEVEIREAASRMDRLVDSATVALLRLLSQTRSVRAGRLGGVGSRSLPALKDFLRAEQFYRSVQWDSVEFYARRAVTADSTFALARVLVADAESWLGRATGSDEGRRAARFNRGLTSRDSLYVASRASRQALTAFPSNSDSARAILRRTLSTMEEWARRFPDDPQAWFELGEFLYHDGFNFGTPRRRILEAFERSIALDSAFGPSYFHAIEGALEFRGLDAARRFARVYVSLDPTNAAQDDEAVGTRLVAARLDHSGVSPTVIDQWRDSMPAGPLGVAMADLKRWPDSLETAVVLARGAWAPGQQFRWGQPLANSLSFRGHLRESRRIDDRQWSSRLAEHALAGAVPADSVAPVLLRLLARDSLPAPMLPWFASRGDIAAISAFGRRAQSGTATMNEVTRQRAAYAARAGPAFLALALHDTTETLTHLLALPDSLCRECFLDRLVRVQLLRATGRYREAATLLDDDLVYAVHDLRMSEVLWALERGRVFERLGERQRAIAGYRYVADTWRSADPELRPYVGEALAALSRLGAAR